MRSRNINVGSSNIWSCYGNQARPFNVMLGVTHTLAFNTTDSPKVNSFSAFCVWFCNSSGTSNHNTGTSGTNYQVRYTTVSAPKSVTIVIVTAIEIPMCSANSRMVRPCTALQIQSSVQVLSSSLLQVQGGCRLQSAPAVFVRVG